MCLFQKVLKSKNDGKGYLMGDKVLVMLFYFLVISNTAIFDVMSVIISIIGLSLNRKSSNFVHI